MNVKPNIGTINALMRITCGLTMLSWATSKMVKRPWRESYLVVAFLGAMKVGEGVVRYCPLTALYEERQEKMQEQGENKEEQDQMIPYNPT